MGIIHVDVRNTTSADLFHLMRVAYSEYRRIDPTIDLFFDGLDFSPLFQATMPAPEDPRQALRGAVGGNRE